MIFQEICNKCNVIKNLCYLLVTKSQVLLTVLWFTGLLPTFITKGNAKMRGHVEVKINFSLYPCSCVLCGFYPQTLG